MKQMEFKSPIQHIENNIWIKRDDLIPFSFGGNKARKARLFFKDFDEGDYDCVVTYGSSSSNHCRIIANIAASRRIKCVIVSPEEERKTTYNSQLINMFGADVKYVPLNTVHNYIKESLDELQKAGNKPYFIQGGGHGKFGTQAYAECYEEIKDYEKTHNIFFDYIFFASGTGTTQAGLVSGQLLNKDYSRKIIGISIARKNPRGRSIVIDSIKEFLGEDFSIDLIEEKTFFIDSYVGEGYGKQNQLIDNEIENAMKKHGIPLDQTYTGKAFYGMRQYIKENKIENKKILFIHTGGTPLFFDFLKAKRSNYD